MALLKWNQEDDPNKDDLFNPAPIKTVSSVQSGSWQPTADDTLAGTDQPQQNYLVSDEKAKADAVQAQKRAAEEARAAAVAEQADAARRAQATQEIQDNAPLDGDMAAKDEGWKKYYDDNFKKENDSLDFFGRLMDNGQASRRAEVNARNQYVSELNTQAYDDNGNLLDQSAADRARSVSAYNLEMAKNNGKQTEAISNAIGATKTNPDEDFWDRVKSTANAIKNMSIYDGIVGADDSTRFSANDIGRFAGGIGQGIFTAPIIGGKELYEAGSGNGTDDATGLQKELDASERIGRGVSGALNVASPFLGGSGKLLESLTAKVGAGVATAAEKTLLQTLKSKVLLPAIEQGAIGATQSGAEYFGQGGDLVDENGKLDPKKLLEFAKQTGQGGAMGFGGGAILGATALGVNKLRGRNLTPVDMAELSDLETRTTNAGEMQLANAQRFQQPEIDLKALEQRPELTPLSNEPLPKIADGIATPEQAPVATPTPVTPDAPVNFEKQFNASDLSRPTNLLDEAANDTTPIVPENVTPITVDKPVDNTPVTDTTPVENSVPTEVPPVSDGTVLPNKVMPAEAGNIPVIKSEEVRNLQDARAGKSQADESQINQRLQELQNIPRGERTEAQSSELNNIILGGFDKVRKQLGSDGDFYNNFLVQEADKPTRSADLALEIIGKVENDGMSIKDALDDSLIPDVPKTSRESAQDSYDSLSGLVRDLEKSSNQPGLWKSVQSEMKGMNVEERVKYLDSAWKKMRAEGTLAKDFVNKENGYTPETAPLQKTVPVGDVTPVVSENLPMLESAKKTTADATPDNMETPTNGKLTPAQVAERLMPKLADNKDVKQRIATAAGLDKDVESPIRDILRDAKVEPKRAERVATNFDKLEKQVQEYNKLEEMNQKAYAEGGSDALDPEVSKSRSRSARDMGITTRRLMADIKRMEGHKDKKVALLNNINDIIGTRNASVLSSMGLLERNVMQELTANAKLAIKNPIKMARSTFNSGNIIKDTAKSEISHWADLPSKNPIEIVKYVVGNTYRTAMIPTTVLANTRRGAVREELTKWAYKELEGREIGSAEAKKLSGTAGNEMEALVNTFIGVDNGMTNRGQATAALKSWKEYIRTGDDGAKSQFLSKVEQHNSLADQMIAGLSKDDQTKFRGLKAMGNLIFPFVRTASNLAINTVKQDINPMAKSLLDEIRVDQRSGGQNVVNLIKSKLVDYGIMGGAAALATSGVLVYGDENDVDKPKGWSLHLGGDNYVPVRSTSLELPIALAGTAQAIARDVAAGKPRDWKYYAGMVTQSLPYIDQINTTTGAMDSLSKLGDNEEGDGGYAAKAYAVNMGKSFVPFSNNGVQPYVAGKEGKSLNAKSVYDKNLLTWFTNTVRKSYDPDFYNSLNDNRDNAGRVRTVDNQGIVSNKTINDDQTKTYNQDVSDLVKYARENKIGDGVQDMFNSYDTGKNNNFKSIQDSITFLDTVEGADGKKTPKNEDKLKSNPKLSTFSQQIRDGFFGETGNDLLTLDGKNLYSDVSVPNSAGSKNSRLPISMQSIKNAIAQTDLPEDQRNRIYEISQGDTDLYNKLKNKEISYDQYTAEKAKTGQEYIDILSNSDSYKRMTGLFDELDQTGFFDEGGMGSTRSGQTYLWNSLNSLLGSKGATPAANYPDASKNYTPYSDGMNATNKPGDRKNEGIKWSPVGARKQSEFKAGKYTPVQIKVKLDNAIKKDKSQNYSDRNF